MRISDWSSDVCSSDLQYIATAYGSLGTIHMPRYVASILLGEMLLEVRGTRLYTRLGTPVIAGAGYPEASTSGAAGGWIVAVPAFLLYRSEIFHPPNRTSDLLNRLQPHLSVQAARRPLVGWEQHAERSRV